MGTCGNARIYNAPNPIWLDKLTAERPGESGRGVGSLKLYCPPPKLPRKAPVAQLVELLLCNQQAAGSSPAGGSNSKKTGGHGMEIYVLYCSSTCKVKGGWGRVLNRTADEAAVADGDTSPILFRLPKIEEKGGRTLGFFEVDSVPRGQWPTVVEGEVTWEANEPS